MQVSTYRYGLRQHPTQPVCLPNLGTLNLKDGNEKVDPGEETRENEMGKSFCLQS
jgi:hypothetical protein